ncbi:MAG: T9SS type A sorting domain-containing protein, partial [Ignavibacterium sp.]
NNDNVAEVHTKDLANSIELKNEMIEINTLYNIGLNLQTINPGTNRSDHASFWNRGYGAILLIEEFYGGDFNAYYHTTNDLITNFNQEYYLKMTKAANGTLATLSNLTGIVPVELLSFSGFAVADGVSLKWVTASELNNLGFEIERSIDATAFVTIGFVEGKGSSTILNQYSFMDYPVNLANNVFYYRLKQFDYDSSYDYSQVIEVKIVNSFSLAQNYPNPFNPSTNISFSIPKAVDIKLSVYNLIGEEVAVLKEGFTEAGRYDVEFSVQSAAGGLPSGIYFYKLKAGDFVQVKKMSLMK